MNKGLIKALIPLLLLAASLAVAVEGEIYKVVDENGNVTYTDQRPGPGAQPMDLPELSVIETDIQAPEAPPQAAAAEEQPPTTRELRGKFRDFRIMQPQPDETFWGTANTVVVSWGSSESVPPEMSVRLYVDGEARDVEGSGSVTLTLDRGEHTVYAELLDARKRRIVTTETVTFHVKQHSVNFNQPVATPRNTGP